MFWSVMTFHNWFTRSKIRLSLLRRSTEEKLELFFSSWNQGHVYDIKNEFSYKIRNEFAEIPAEELAHNQTKCQDSSFYWTLYFFEGTSSNEGDQNFHDFELSSSLWIKFFYLDVKAEAITIVIIINK